MSFPDGRDGAVALNGRARDLLTLGDPAGAIILAENMLDARVGKTKIIERFRTDPPLAGTDELVGCSAIAGYRSRLRPLLTDRGVAEMPLALLLDDMVGSSIVATWVWTKWLDDRAELNAWLGDGKPVANACVGYRTGSSGLTSDAYLDKIDYVAPLGRDEDPLAFHELAPDEEKTMRRVRRIDIWRHGDAIEVDAMFQDSGVVPGPRRSAVHEYRVRATADAATGVLRVIEATPGALPHPECLGATAAPAAMLGRRLSHLRTQVLSELRGVASCTHLNDAMRALAEVPPLAARLESLETQ